MFNFWNKNKEKPEQISGSEDITLARNLQEKMASLQVGQTFALSTRTGMHVFRKTSIQEAGSVRDKSKK